MAPVLGEELFGLEVIRRKARYCKSVWSEELVGLGVATGEMTPVLGQRTSLIGSGKAIKCVMATMSER